MAKMKDYLIEQEEKQRAMLDKELERDEPNVCGLCGGTGLVEIEEFVVGDNIQPGGFYQGSGEFKKCQECSIDISNDI